LGDLLFPPTVVPPPKFIQKLTELTVSCSIAGVERDGSPEFFL
jgi:hypothetical protein